MSARRSRRLLGWSLFLAGFVAMVAHGGEFERMDLWGWLAVPALAAAPLVGFRDRPVLRWLLATVPFWMFGSANELLLLAAVGLSVGAAAVAVVRPTLPGRRVRGSATPLPQLASGPLVPVPPLQFSGGRRSRLLRYAAFALAGLSVLLFASAAAGYTADVSLGLGISAAIVASTFAFANWFADRVRLRVDAVGVHGRTLFREHTARWSEVTGLRLRYLLMPGHGVRVVYYVVEAAGTEVAFPSSMAGAQELRAAVEAATGVRWPEPEITPTM